jgi:histidyl-tRNA synthetase
VDAELIALNRACWERLGIQHKVRLEVNTLGSSEGRAAYRDALVTYLSGFRDELDPDSQRRLETNPLRILDSKDGRTREVLTGAPTMDEYIDDGARRHYQGLLEHLDALNIAYVENPHLVRGLDYYNYTVFEWITEDLGAQGTICGGGRYDGLVEQLGGKPTPGAGFALGLERVLLLYEQLNLPTRPATDVYCCVADPDCQSGALETADRLRRARPELRIRVHAGGGKLKNQLKKADQSGAAWVIIFGPDEMASGQLTVKDLRSGEQTAMGFEEAVARFFC